MVEWITNNSINSFAYNEDKSFYVSYNPDPKDWLSNILLMDTGAETALYGETKDGLWHILRGDFRKEYEELIPLGWEACLKFYNSKKAEFRCAYSTD